MWPTCRKICGRHSLKARATTKTPKGVDSQGGLMRVVLDTLTAIRQKTGIGHYVTELVRCLRRQHPDQQFATYPGPLVTAAATVSGRLQRAFAGMSHGHS